MSVYQLRKKLEPQLLRVPGVTGVGNLTDRIRLYVEGSPKMFLKHIEGIMVEVVKTGKLKALSLMNVPWFVPKPALQIDRTQRLRPVPGGVSISHPLVTAGTMGTTITVGGAKFGLSNNHVLAAASSYLNPRASMGDLIFQPGTYDGGTESDAIGTLEWYLPFDEGGMNIIDAAIFKPASEDLLSDEILEIGTVAGVSSVGYGDLVQKSGRTTGVTTSEVIDVEATMKVDYGTFELTFANQIVTNYMADGGDSGSALLDMNRNLVGLLFAGSAYVTLHNHIADVLAYLGGLVPAPTPPARTPFQFAFPLLVGSFVSGIIG